MLGKLQQLRRRFQDAHFTKMALPRDILNSDGVKAGFIDEISFRDGRLRVQGWVKDCTRVTLSIAGLSRSGTPVATRIDVSQVLAISPQIGFDLTLPLTAAQFCADPQATITCVHDSDGPLIPPVEIDFRPLWKARLRTNLRFLKAALLAFPIGLRWIISRSHQDRALMLNALGLNPIETTNILESRLFDPANAGPVSEAHRITILLPVYDAFDLLPEVLDRVIRHTDVPFHLILIEDASPDARVRPYLRDWVGSQPSATNVTLIENSENLGFIGSINAGFALALSSDRPALPDGCIDGPIVLLNSDAFVPATWASRLIAPLLEGANLASTTPMSNDAEIMSVPVQCQTSDLAPGEVDKLDAAAARFDPQAALVEVPTGVGFCMALARDWVMAVPSLDKIFGRGYGEEVDWCQKVRAKGGHHAALGNLFVEHRGGSSFGSADKLAMIANNNAIVSARYPTYDAEVQSFIANDPLLSPRLALAVVWAGLTANGPVPVYLAHSLGGGAESYLRAKITEDLNAIGAAIVVRVGGALQWRIEVHAPKGVVHAETDSTDVLIALLAQIDQRHIIYSCGVGAPDPAGLPSVLLALYQSKSDALSVLVHDFFMVSPSYTLLGADGVYRGANLHDHEDRAHSYRTASGTTGTVQDWQSKWRALLSVADSIVTFSNNSAGIIAEVWPDLASKIVVTPHTLSTEIRRASQPADPQSGALGLLGGMNFAKGASVVEEVAKQLPNQRIIIIGKVDPSYSMPANVTIHGSYDPVDIAALAQRYQIAHWLIPSIWPETFSFTTHEALATSLPVVTFDLGAQGNAAQRAPNGIVLPFDTDTPPDTSALAASVIHYLSTKHEQA